MINAIARTIALVFLGLAGLHLRFFTCQDWFLIGFGSIEPSLEILSSGQFLPFGFRCLEDTTS